MAWTSVIDCTNLTSDECQKQWNHWNFVNYMASSLPPIDMRPLQSVCSIDSRPTACCDPLKESRMLAQSVQHVDNFYRQWLLRAHDPLTRDAVALQSLYRTNVESTKQNLNAMFTRTYGYQYVSNKDFFLNFLSDLNAYLEGSRSNIRLMLEAFFNELRDRMTRLTLLGGGSGGVISLTEPQIQCIVTKLKEMNSFGQVPETMQNQMLRTYPISRMFVNALSLGGEVLQNILQKAPAYRQCALHHMRTVHCSTCGGTEHAPCHGFCVSMFSQCLAPYADIAAVWPLFIDTLKRAAEKMEQPINLASVNKPLQLQISEAIMDLHTTLQKKKDELVNQCTKSSGPSAANRQQYPAFNGYNSRRRRNVNSEILNWQQNQIKNSPDSQYPWSNSLENGQQSLPDNMGASNPYAGSDDMGSGPPMNQGRAEEGALTGLVQRMKGELASFDKLFSDSMGMCGDALFGIVTLRAAPCWNGTFVGDFDMEAAKPPQRSSVLNISPIPNILLQDNSKVSSVIKREVDRLQDMTAKLTLALQDFDPDYIKLEGIEMPQLPSGMRDNWENLPQPPLPEEDVRPPKQKGSDEKGGKRGRTKKPSLPLMPPSTFPPARPNEGRPPDEVEGSGNDKQFPSVPDGGKFPLRPGNEPDGGNNNLWPLQPPTTIPQTFIIPEEIKTSPPYRPTPPPSIDESQPKGLPQPLPKGNVDAEEGSGFVTSTLAPKLGPGDDEDSRTTPSKSITRSTTTIRTTTEKEILLPLPPFTDSPPASSRKSEKQAPVTELPPFFHEDHVHIDHNNLDKLLHLQDLDLPPELWLPPQEDEEK